MRFEELKTYLTQLTEEGGNYNFLILMLDEAKNYYMTFQSAKGSNTFLLNAVSNNYLTGSSEISEDRLKFLLQNGWTLPADEAKNFTLVIEKNTESIDHALMKIKEVAAYVYGVPNLDMVSVKMNLK